MREAELESILEFAAVRLSVGWRFAGATSEALSEKTLLWC